MHTEQSRKRGEHSHTSRKLLAGAVGIVTVGALSLALLTRAEAADGAFVRVASKGDVGESVDVAFRAGDTALYVAARGGDVVAVTSDGNVTAVADLSDLVETDHAEQGLLGITFSPDGTLAYVNYTAKASGDTVVAELPVVTDGHTVALDPAALRVLLTIEQPYPNHNGGDLLFGPDEMLYIPTGDGGSRLDPDRRAQDLESLLGKLLRIDPSPDTTAGTGYTVPADNPYVDRDGARPEIWAIGLRNPWRVAFDPDTGDLWIADVGQRDVEEVNLAPATDGLGAAYDANFGWSAFEGDRPLNDDVELVDGQRIDPVFTYGHEDGDCSISGGVRVRAAAAPALEGSYVFADYCSARVYVLTVDGDGAEAVVNQEPVTYDGPARPTSVTQGPDGHVYVTADEGLYRFAPDS